SYAPRACDCDFCRRHNAAYVSDPQGSVAVWIQDAGLRGSYRQGSSQAEFLSCRRCGVLIGAFYADGGRLYAAINAHCVRGAKNFTAQQSISLRLLTADEKTARWRGSWFSHVNVLTARYADGLHKL
ncbi:MAG: aldehyde-activating protein, partial [Gammaproteobacteria bacterium]|nr:aldehyde-activating protein [Gammaproteobacteria bacterium]